MTPENKLDGDEVKHAIEYLESGGIGEVLIMTLDAYAGGHPKVQSDTDLMLALCNLAGEAIQARKDAAAKRQ